MKIFDLEVTGITDDSRELEVGNIFVCIKGQAYDGHDCAREMLEKGAASVVAERDLGLEKQIIVPNTRKELARLASEFYGNPTKNLKLIAATGTNGKSTVIALIKHILEEQGLKAASIGTVGYDVVGKTYEAKLTVPRQTELYKLFREAADNGAEYCVVEASSQALAQDRFGDEMFECAVFTNLTQDHLDWHGTMNNYFLAKRALFDMTKSAIVCIDDEYGEKLVKYIEETHNIPVITYSAKNIADCCAVNVKSSGAGVSYWFSSAREEKSFPLKLKMPGFYNVANSIAAITACTELGIPLIDAVNALMNFKGVRGRSEVIHDGEFTIICDYAHTEDALVKILSSVKEFTTGKLICVFGAPGERDAAKRPLMGAAVDKYADYIIITSDNPRFEDEDEIIEQVAAGIKAAPFEKIPDRKEAIRAAVKIAQTGNGDLIVLCGKGHETYQAVRGEDLPFDEREIVKELL